MPPLRRRRRRRRWLLALDLHHRQRAEQRLRRVRLDRVRQRRLLLLGQVGQVLRLRVEVVVRRLLL